MTEELIEHNSKSFKTWSFLFHKTKRNAAIFAKLVEWSQVGRAMWNTMLYYYQMNMDACEEYYSYFDLIGIFTRDTSNTNSIRPFYVTTINGVY